MPVKSNHVYDENDIVLLKGLQGVRKRPEIGRASCRERV